ncbi:MAG: insulinase family protein, partial [Planctomycetaceae bacterium]
QTVQNQAESLARRFQATGDPLFDDRYVEGIQKVTAEEILRVAREYFRPERLNTVIIDPAGAEIETETATIGEDAESPVLRKQLRNGLTVLLKRHAVQPMVSIRAFAKAGVLSDSDETAGRANLAAEVMVRGTEKYTGDEIAEYFDSIGGTLSVESGRNTTYLTADVLADDFTESLDYVHQILFKPAFPQDEFETQQQLQLGQIASRLANPQTEILDFWVRSLPDENPYSQTVEGRPETVSELTADGVREFHRRVFVPQNMVIAVYGDLDPQQTLELMERTFGQVPAAKSFNFREFAKEHENSAAETVRLESEQQGTAMIIIGYPTVSVYDEKTRSALEVLNTLLTGGRGAGGVLFDELRGERLVYYV